MQRRDFLKAAAWSAMASVAARRATAQTGTKPNVVFLMADDLGYGDVQAFNPSSTIPTPHCNRIAAAGMRFTDAHSGSAVCTPTRYGVVTGRYSWRTSMKRGVLNGYSKALIAADRVTVADVMKGQGYKTACIGKWHLGMGFPLTGEKDAGGLPAVDYAGRIEQGPQDCGFDYNYNIIASLDMPPYVYVENDRFTEAAADHYPGSSFPNFVRKGPVAPGFDFTGCLDHLTDKAVDYIAARGKEKDQPFFLYFPLTAPHKPALPHPRFRGKSGLGDYGDFVMQVDDTIGRVDQALEAAGLAENTLFIITSDNGSYMYRSELAPEKERPADGADHVTRASVQAYRPDHHRANFHWRGTKADVWEGGHHVVYIAKWPARVEAGSACDSVICHTDLLATCAEVSGAETGADVGEDSFSILPLLLGKQPATRRPPVVHHSGSGTFAIRNGRWKLIFDTGSGGRGNPRGKRWEEPYQLYDMRTDPSETTNRIADPECAPALKELMDWAGKLGVLAERPA